MQPIFDTVVEKMDNINNLSSEEKEFYQAYFVENNIFGNSPKDDECIYEDWIEYAHFLMEEDLKDLADEYVHENAAQLLENIIDENTIYQLSKEGEIVDKFNSQIEAAQAMGAKTSANINNVIVGKQKTAYGYKWVRACDYLGTKKN